MKLVIFDCDGTLVDSEFLCNLALQHQLGEIGVEYQACDLILIYRGIQFESIMSCLESELSIKLPEYFEVEYRKKVRDLFDEKLKANEGVEAVLRSLNLPICVASSAPRAKIEQALQVTGLKKYFNDNHIFSAYEVGSWKPEPGLFLHAAKIMGFEPKDCCVVEDSLVGLQAANQAKMKSIYYAPHTNDRNIIAKAQIKHMSALLTEITIK